MQEHLAPADVAFGAASAFLLGIFVVSLDWNIPFTLISVFICGAGTLTYLHHPGLWKAFIIFFLTLISGIFYFHLYFNLSASWEDIPMGKKISFMGIIADEPKISEKYQSLVVSLEPPLKGTISILAPPLDVFHYGDIIQATGSIDPPRSIANLPTAAFIKTRVVAEHKGFWLREQLIDFKASLLGQFSKTLPSEEAALLGGITLGSQAGFTKEFKDQMALSGTTHLVALSGYNISILVLAVAQVFGRFLSRRKTFYVTTVIISLFVLMVGFGASVVRAAIMGFLALLAKEIGRMFSMRNAIVLTAAGMVIANPAVLAYDAGFQLSFASLLGIVYVSPAVKKFLHIDAKDITGLFETALMTLSAQLTVMPLIIQTFGRFSLTAVFTNVLILEFMPLTMFFGFLLAGVGMLGLGFAFAVAKLAEILLAYEIGVIKLFADLAVPISAPFADQFLIVAAYYACLAAFVLHYGRERQPI